VEVAWSDLLVGWPGGHRRFATMCDLYLFAALTRIVGDGFITLGRWPPDGGLGRASLGRGRENAE